MRYKLVIFDIDGTITTHISSWRYIHERLDLWDAIARRYQTQFLTGKISYLKFCNLDAAHWKGLREKDIISIFNEVPYAKNIRRAILSLKRHGFVLAALSTGLQFMADRIKNELGFDYVLSNALVVKNGILTGRVKINIAHGSKGIAFKKVVRHFRLRPKEVIAIGDTSGDIPMTRLAGYSIAFNSCSKELSGMVDYNCRSRDFLDVYRQIIAITKER